LIRYQKKSLNPGQLPPEAAADQLTKKLKKFQLRTPAENTQFIEVNFDLDEPYPHGYCLLFILIPKSFLIGRENVAFNKEKR